jgi:glycerol-3-phosphate dehydrogenase (NAD(P)+)
VELAHGRGLDEILASTKMIAEGVRTTQAALALGAARGIELPIAAKMADVLDGKQEPQAAVFELMGRRQTHE